MSLKSKVQSLKSRYASASAASRDGSRSGDSIIFYMAATNVISTAASPALVSTNALRDIKPPVEIPSGWLWAFWIVGALLLAALAYLAWQYWTLRRMQAAVVPIVPPHVRAKQRLQEALGLLGQPREFCIMVSDTIRYYLEERFTFRAPERTTEEFLYELRQTNLLTPDQKESLGEFLKRCDLVKFARYEPGEPELRDLHDSALRLVEETEPIEMPTAGKTEPAQHEPDSPLVTRHSSPE